MSAPELLRTRDSADSAEGGKLRYAAADGYCVDVWRGVSGNLTVRVYGARNGAFFYHAVDQAEALERARGMIDGWRAEQPAARQAAAG